MPPDVARERSIRCSAERGWLSARGTIALAVVLIGVLGVGAWSGAQISRAASQVDRSTAVLVAYQRVQLAVSDEAFSEAGYRRSRNDASRARLEGALDALDTSVVEVRRLGSTSDRATVSHLVALNERYSAEVRRSLDGSEEEVQRDDRVAGPALDAMQSLMVAAIAGRQAEVDRAVASQHDIIDQVLLLVPAVVLLALTAAGASWFRMVSHQRRLALAAQASDDAASRDPLTGLANRRHFERILDLRLAESEVDWALLLVDLDEFKAVNDTHGHQAGDDVLTAVGQRLASAVRGGDVVARIGGDEFAIIADAPDDIAGLSERLLQATRAPIEHLAGTVHSSISIGSTRAAPGITRQELLARADRALYAAKARGRDQAVLT